jgi:hypothetical protein
MVTNEAVRCGHEFCETWTGELRITANFTSKLQVRPLVRKSAPQHEARKCPTVIKIWSWAPDGVPTPRQIGRLTVGSKITWTWTYQQLDLIVHSFPTIQLILWTLLLLLLLLVVVVVVVVWLYSPLLNLGRFLSSLILQTVGKTPWTGDQLVASPLPAQRTVEIQNKGTQASMPWRDSNSQPQCLRGRRQFMPQPALPLRSAILLVLTEIAARY